MASDARIYVYSTCTTCKKALNWLREHQINFQIIDISKEPPSKQILIEGCSQLGNRQKLFNTSGLSYRSLGSKVVKSMSDSEAFDALASDGKLIKRPFLITDQGKILVGFKPELWSEILL